MQRILTYLNPLAQLGSKKYTVIFPGIVTTVFYLLSEFIAIMVLNNPDLVGLYIIFFECCTYYLHFL